MIDKVFMRYWKCHQTKTNWSDTCILLRKRPIKVREYFSIVRYNTSCLTTFSILKDFPNDYN